MSSIQDFFTEAEDILFKYLPDIDTRDFIKGLQGKIQLDLGNISLFSKEEEQVSDYDWADMIGDTVYGFLNGLTFGVFGGVVNVLSHSSNKVALLNAINEKRNSFNCGDALQCAFTNKDKIIETIRQALIDDMLHPLQEKVEEIRNDKANKEKNLENAKTALEELMKKKSLLEEQLNEIVSFKEAI